MPPYATEGLAQTAGLLVQNLPMIRRQLRHQPAVELVAVAGDPREQVGQWQACGGRSRPVAGQTRGHQDHARQHGSRLAPQLRLPLRLEIGRRLDRRLGPRQDAVECGLLHHHAPVEALAVDAGGIPQAEEIVGPTRCGMQKIKRARIECQFFQHGEFEVSLPQERFRRLFEDRHRILHQPAVTAVRSTRSADEQRHRPDPLVWIGLRELAVFQHGHRPPADVVVEPANRLPHDGVEIGTSHVAGQIAGQDGLCCRHQEEGPLKTTRRLMLEQIAVEGTVGRKQPGEEQVEHRPGLRGVPKCGLGCRKCLQPLGEKNGHTGRGIGPLHDRAGGGGRGVLGGRLDSLKNGIHRPPDGRIEGPGREVQIPQYNGRGITRSGPLRIGLRGGSGIGGGVLPHRQWCLVVSRSSGGGTGLGDRAGRPGV